jgi:Fe-S-cluster containining protein
MTRDVKKSIPEQTASNRKALLDIYSNYDIWAEDYDFACEKGCATCCTQSVTMTTLEGELIHDYIVTEPDLPALLEELPENSPAPATTTNSFALACMQGMEGDENNDPWNLDPCKFLKDNCCSIYPVRPFMCRSFGSQVKCHLSGSAEITPLFLTLNTVIMQCIEHLDQGRPWGNMNAILRNLGRKGGNERKCHQPLPLSRPIPGFLIPPDEADRLSHQVHILLKIIKKTGK